MGDLEALKSLTDEYLKTDARRYVQLDKIFAFQTRAAQPTL